MVNAVLAAEDKRFFEHGALDVVRVFGAAFYDLTRSRKAQGASTIDMQVARTFFFTTKREWRRKLKEILMAAELDQRFSKHQIFELYANDIYLGNRGSFAIRGFGEAAQAYFGKDVRELSLGEAAFLAGIIRAPNRYSAAERHPTAPKRRATACSAQMAEDDYITADEEAAAKNARLQFVTGGVSSSSAPYFVDMVKDHLLEKIFRKRSRQPELPHLHDARPEPAARRHRGRADRHARTSTSCSRSATRSGRSRASPRRQAQVALVALDPHTGEIRALIGGRDYGESQLNHALAHRQPGSVFKPFVYAAAFDNAVEGLQPVVTPVTTVDDIPTTFEFDGKEYTPDNYGQEFYGTVTVRDALIHSLNVATVKVAEMIGYQRVVDVARQMGLGSNIKATPAVALGAYEMTPIEVAAGYTAFAANGMRAEPLFIRSVVTADGKLVEIERATVAARARSARRVPHHQPDGGRDQPRHRLSRSRAGIQRARRRQDRHLARRLVRRLHLESPLRRVGRLRRQSQPRLGRRQDRRAHLGRVHEARRHAAHVPQHAAVHASRRRDGSDRRSAKRPAGHCFLPADSKRILHRGQRAHAILPAARRPGLG